MNRLTIIGMGIIALALNGCVDDQDVQSLRNAYLSVSNEVNQLQARMAAVEQACLQINTRLVEAEYRRTAADQTTLANPANQTAPARPAAASPRDSEQVALFSEPRFSDKLTRSSFSRRLAGMTLSEVLTMLGQPDKTSEAAGAQHWIYQRVNLTMADGGQEISPALVVFEQGCVTRATLTENIPSPAEPKEKEPENSAVNSNITAEANPTAVTSE